MAKRDGGVGKRIFFRRDVIAVMMKAKGSKRRNAFYSIRTLP